MVKEIVAEKKSYASTLTGSDGPDLPVTQILCLLLLLWFLFLLVLWGEGLPPISQMFMQLHKQPHPPHIQTIFLKKSGKYSLNFAKCISLFTK